MDDDDEIHSHPSPVSDSPPPSPPSNGRITVTVAAVPPGNHNNLTLALPIQQQPPSRSAGNGGGREDCWSEGATAVLIEAWGERYLELSRGNLKQKHWKEVADIVSSHGDFGKAPKTDIQCKNRIDTVKKKYKLEKAKIASGGGVSKWPFYDRLDQLIGPAATKTPAVGTSSVAMISPVVSKGVNVPMGIPVGIRSVQNFHKQQGKQKLGKRRAPVDSEESEDSESEPSRNSGDSFPPETYEPKRPRFQNLSAGAGRTVGYVGWKGKEKEKEKPKEEKEKNSSNWGNSVRELTRAILKFGQAYEHAESSKLQQLVEMEKQRMKFAKELELQRMQFFMKTQLELSQLKRRRGGNSTSNKNNHHTTSNNSDSSN